MAGAGNCQLRLQWLVGSLSLQLTERDKHNLALGNLRYIHPYTPTLRSTFTSSNCSNEVFATNNSIESTKTTFSITLLEGCRTGSWSRVGTQGRRGKGIASSHHDRSALKHSLNQYDLSGSQTLSQFCKDAIMIVFVQGQTPQTSFHQPYTCSQSSEMLTLSYSTHRLGVAPGVICKLQKYSVHFSTVCRYACITHPSDRVSSFCCYCCS